MKPNQTGNQQTNSAAYRNNHTAEKIGFYLCIQLGAIPCKHSVIHSTNAPGPGNIFPCSVTKPCYHTIPWTEWSAHSQRNSSATSTRWTRSKHCSNTPKRTSSISPSSLPSTADCEEARHLGCRGATSTLRMTKSLSGRRCWRSSATAKWNR